MINESKIKTIESKITKGLNGSKTNKFEYLNIPTEKVMVTNQISAFLNLFNGTEIL